MLTIARGTTKKLKVVFYEYESGPLFDPLDFLAPTANIYLNEELIAGPFHYDNGTGSVIRESLGIYYVNYVIDSEAELGVYTISWSGGPTSTGVEEFQIYDPSPVVPINVSQNLLKPPSVIANMRESPLYQILGTGVTDTIYLLGHSNSLTLNDPFRVRSVQDAINVLGADEDSPLLRALLEAYYSGARDIVIVAVAPMTEYISDINDRNTPKSELGNKTFYHSYYDRLNTTYQLLLEHDAADIIVPVEASFYNADVIDFAEQLKNHCSESFAISGKIRLGILGTRGSLSDEMVDALNEDPRVNNSDSASKFITIVVGEGLVSLKEMPTAYSASVAASVAGLLSTLPLSRGLTYLPLPNIVSPNGIDLSSDQITSLSNKKLNPIIRTTLGKRGRIYTTVLATDNTFGEDGTDFWSLVQMRLVAKAIRNIRAIGRSYIGSINFVDFRFDVQRYLVNLTKTNQIRSFDVQINRSPAEATRVLVDLSLRPYFGIRDVQAAIEVGPAISSGSVF